MARKNNGEYKTKLASQRQIVIDQVQAERREERRARKLKRAMEIQNKENAVEIATPTTALPVRNELMALFSKAKTCFIGYGNTHKTMKYIRNSYEMERVCVKFGIPVAEEKITEAWDAAKDAVTAEVQQFMENALITKATSCFSSHGNTHTTGLYIRNSWEFQDLVKNFGEKIAEGAVHSAFLTVFPSNVKIAA